MNVEFSAHNIRLDNDVFTKPDIGYTISEHPWMISARRIFSVVFPQDRNKVRIADLGCLEGGYSTELARMGFQVLGIEVRENNFAACLHVKANTNLPNLEFVRDDVWNVAKYGKFDAIFCCGLFYHIDHPRRFLELLSSVTKRMLLLQTHFSTDSPHSRFVLSDLTEHEALQGRWYREFADEAAYLDRENDRWASWDNRESFWLKREHLLQAIQNSGFDLVAEQYDGLGGDIAGSMTSGYYKSEDRGTFLGIKTEHPSS